MERNINIRVIFWVLLLWVAVQPGAQQQYCNSSNRGNVGNGYHYELWTNGTGSVCMTVYGQEAGFKTEWNNVGDFVARVGLAFDETKTASQLGTLSADYAFTKSGVTRLAYMGIYGWTVNPLVEYYIVEDWNEWRPNYTHKGTVTLDGDEYDIMTNTQVNQPSIKGNATFTQWWSVRKKGRQNGHVSISDHFAAWRNAGAQLGQMYEAKLNVEGMNGGGAVDFTKATVVLSKPGQVRLPPKGDRETRAYLGNGNATGVRPCFSLNGAVAGSMPPNGPDAAVSSADRMAAGRYFLRPTMNGKVNGE